MKKKRKEGGCPPSAVSCDLHTHSFYSDGALPPKEMVRTAVEKNVRYWALTDHDTVDGLPEAAAAAADAGIVFIPGTEITIEDYEGRPFHLLGLGVDGGRAQLSALCRRQSARRRERFLEICRRIAAHGIDIDGELILSSERGAPGRLRIARELIRLKEVCSLQEAFARYLGAHTGNVVPFEKTPLEEAVAAIRDAGGLTFVAHPLSLNLNWDRTEAFLSDVKARGVDGVEVVHSSCSAVRMRYLLAAAQRLGMLISGGSDFHGSDKPNAVFGRTSDGKPIPLFCLPTVLKEKYCQSFANGL